jgi:hypothetical protein
MADNPMKTVVSEGSLWRRWDPHVHLPGTLRNDNFKSTTVEQALGILASRSPKIEVVGITDYFSTASFHRAVAALQSGAGSGLTMLFPNVEVRLAHATARKSAVNAHLLCAPDEVEELERFLRGLTFRHEDVDYQCSDEDLVRLGRAWRKEPRLPEGAARREFRQLERLYLNSTWAKDNLLVGVAAGEGDGTSGLRTDDDSFAAIRRNLERFAHIIFSSKPSDVEFWSGKRADSEAVLEERYKGKKVCLHGSDAHEADDLGAPHGDRFCWLKGDPTFETLRMTCLSPETRAHIGATDPLEGYRPGRIRHVEVPDQGWFPSSGIPVNAGLVAIIGARGRGKTALADIIAAGAGSDVPFDNEKSFLRRAGGLLRGSAGKVTWTQGETTERALSGSDVIDPFQLVGVRYLSQQFVEQLCASEGVSDNLLDEIERVVFASIPVGDRQGATSFQDLLDIRLQASRGRGSDELEAIADVSERITTERAHRDSMKGLTETHGQVRNSLTLLETRIGNMTRVGVKGDAGRLGLVTEALEQRLASLQGIERRRTELTSLRERVASARTTTFRTLLDTLRTSHPRVGLSEEEWAQFTPRFSGPVDEVLARAIEKAAAEETAARGDGAKQQRPTLDGIEADQLSRLPVADLAAEQQRLQALIGLDRERAENLKKLNQQASQTRARLKQLDEQLAHATGAERRMDALRQQRLDHYAAYFDALLREESELRTLYEPLEALLSVYGGTTAKLKLTVRRKVDVSRWAQEGEELLDLRGRVFKSGTLKNLAEAALLDAWERGDGGTAAAAIAEFSTQHSSDFRRQQKPGGNDPDGREWERNLSRWLYSASHISLSYSLAYDKLRIESLSPGTRGIVLLLLYLAVDQAESDPLIIDQPEENLDPESVYSELVQLFRAASRRRQIIMVTHNANLVVNTDVDQVIVAQCENFEDGKLPELRYTAGGLESPHIRELVCEVLEGGAEAFRQRARRLRIAM